ncbi:unnamed protein product [Prorocentrum cordatum]|uniref:Uncharacterized protein n=1 Tax=Prorocentrum cordatum TaxID=2364126 RepID=A0ABN9U9B7_9DINO|nr:unnamed protein product [Polarella glacialis]
MDAVSQPAVGARRPDGHGSVSFVLCVTEQHVCSASGHPCRSDSCNGGRGHYVLRAPASVPRAEVARRAGLAGQDTFDKEALWLEFCGWKASATQYASALRLYGHGCTVHRLDSWPPAHANVDAFVVLFRSVASLSRYVSHSQSTLQWTRFSLGALSDTNRIVRGAEKTGRASRRLKIRDTAEQT